MHDPYRTPRSTLESSAAPQVPRVRAVAAGSLTAVLGVLVAASLIPSAGAESLVVGSILGAAAAGGFVAARLGRPHPGLHATIVGAIFVVFLLAAIWLATDGGDGVQPFEVAGVIGLSLGASVFGGWMARMIGAVSRS